MSIGRPNYSQIGLTLVELLIALVMGLVLLAGVVTVFIANKQTYKFQDALARAQENGRVAMAILERDLRQAGDSGCLKTLKSAEVTLNLPASFPNFVGPPVTGADGGESGWTPPLETAVSFFNLSATPIRNGTDVITIRGGESEGIRVTKHNIPAANFKTTPRADLCEFDIVLVTDCKVGSVLQITNLQNQSGQLSTVVHNTGVGTPGNAYKELQINYGPPNIGEIIRLNARSYFVADNGRGGWSLYRAGFRRPGSGCSSNSAGPLVEELVEGVEDLQALYGVDDDENGSVDKYEDASAVTDWSKVRAVRVAILVQSVEERVLPTAVSPNEVVWLRGADAEYHDWSWGDSVKDRRLRQAYTATIALRNYVP